MQYIFLLHFLKNLASLKVMPQLSGGFKQTCAFKSYSLYPVPSSLVCYVLFNVNCSNHLAVVASKTAFVFTLNHKKVFFQ